MPTREGQRRGSVEAASDSKVFVYRGAQEGDYALRVLRRAHAMKAPERVIERAEKELKEHAERLYDFLRGEGKTLKKKERDGAERLLATWIAGLSLRIDALQKRFQETQSQEEGENIPLRTQEREAQEKEEEPAADRAYKEKLDHLQGILRSVEDLFDEEAPPKERILRMLDAALSALGAAHLTYERETAGMRRASLISRRDMIARTCELYAHRAENLLSSGKDVTPRPLRVTPRTPRIVPEAMMAPSETTHEGTDLTHIIAPKERVEGGAVSAGSRLKSGVEYLWSRGGSAMEASIAYHIRGEKTKEELGERERSRYGFAAACAASLLRTAMSYGGVQVAPDVFRYQTQAWYTAKEREALRRVITEAVEVKRGLEGREGASGAAYEELLEKARRMGERIEASRYITREEKAELLSRVFQAVTKLEEGRQGTEEDFHKAIAAIIDEAVQSRITRAQVLQEAVDSVMATTGFTLLQAPAYVGFVLVERYRALAKETGREGEASEEIQHLVVDGFVRTVTEFVGEVKKGNAYEALLLLGSTIRSQAMRYARRELWEYFPTKETMTHEELHDRITDALQAFIGRDLASVIHEMEKALPLVPEMGDVDMPPHHERGVVRPGDQVTSVFTRTIEADPHRYGYHGPDDELARDLFARKLSKELVMKEGLLNMWFTERAIGTVAAVPLRDPDGWRVGFVDVRTEELLSGEELSPFLAPKPRG